MCAGSQQLLGAFIENFNPSLRSGALPYDPARHRYGVGFSEAYTPSEYLNDSSAGIAEKNRRKSLTPDQYGRGIWGEGVGFGSDSTLSSTKSSTKESAPPPVLRDNISNGASDLKISKRRDRAEKRKVASGRSVSKVKTFKGK